MSLALRRRLARLERVEGEPVFGGGNPGQLRELAGLIGEVVGSDHVGLPAVALTRALDRMIKDASNAELERLIESLRDAAEVQQA